MSITITADEVAQILDCVAWCDVHENYSGRGMYGETCLGFAGDIGAIELGVIMCDVLGLDKALELANRSASDSLGVGTITYFPGVTIEDED